jgi:CheY-like chemotaxis protein
MTRILIADDEPDYVMFLRRKLENMGYEVDETYRASQVIEKLGDGQFDLVLLDYSMPDMTADEVCYNLKQDAKFKNTPVIIFTAHSNVDQKELSELGVREFLRKPLDDEELEQAIKKHVSRS